MKDFFPAGMLPVTSLVLKPGLTKAGRLLEATAALQRRLGALPASWTEHLPTAEAACSDSRFLSRMFANQAGSRPYKLYIPAGYDGQPVPLVVMLHGCTQSPDDFATGTRMNMAAETHTCLVAYPAQISTANAQNCWNWFNRGEQRRDAGEPSLIAGITRQIMCDFAIDPARAYVAGLSAGGAAAAVMGDAYPELYAAIGVHSGLACGAARDMQSAFAVMQNGGDGHARFDKPRLVPTIIFHGERDTTVNVRNSDAVAAQAMHGASLRTQVEAGQVPGGYAYTRTLQIDGNGQTMVEQWLVRGAGHAWFGGSPAGSFTDPRGPDATKEMLRFFFEHRL
jgi:poly(hydroxyalkanoate) depolymerase family esterase